MSRPSRALMATACEKFNASHPVGTVILCWPGALAGDPVERIVAAPGARVVLGDVSVAIRGGGSIWLDHVVDMRHRPPALPRRCDTRICAANADCLACCASEGEACRQPRARA